MRLKIYTVVMSKEQYEYNKAVMRDNILAFVKPEKDTVACCIWLKPLEAIKARYQLLKCNLKKPRKNRIKMCGGVITKEI